MKTKKIIFPIIWSIIGLLLFAVPAFATEASLNSSLENSQQMIGSLMNMLLPIMRMTGVVLLVAGIGRFLISFMNEDSNSRFQAMTSIIAAIMIMTLPTIASVIFEEVLPEENVIEQEEEQEEPAIIEEVEI